VSAGASPREHRSNPLPSRAKMGPSGNILAGTPSDDLRANPGARQAGGPSRNPTMRVSEWRASKDKTKKLAVSVMGHSEGPLELLFRRPRRISLCAFSASRAPRASAVLGPRASF